VLRVRYIGCLVTTRISNAQYVCINEQLISCQRCSGFLPCLTRESDKGIFLISNVCAGNILPTIWGLRLPAISYAGLFCLDGCWRLPLFLGLSTFFLTVEAYSYIDFGMRDSFLINYSMIINGLISFLYRPPLYGRFRFNLRRRLEIVAHGK